MTTPKNTRKPTAHLAPFGVRMQPELKAQLEAVAAASGRSMNAEIVDRLARSLYPPSIRALHERRKMELLAAYMEWCDRHNLDSRSAFSDFAMAYDSAREVYSHPDVERVSGLDSVDEQYLVELYATWVIERPSRFPILADENSEARRVMDFFTMVNLIQAEALKRGVKVRVSFEGDPNPSAVSDLAESLEAMKGLIKKR